MGDACAVCYDLMNVPGYKHLEEHIPQIEEDCTRLGCGHAFHSTCVIRSLQSYQGKCVLCNVGSLDRRFDSAEEKLRYQGACLRLLKTVKRKPNVKESFRDYKAFDNELTKKRIEFTKRVKEFKSNLRNELDIERVIRDVKHCRSMCIHLIRKEARASGSVYGAAIFNINPWNIDKWFFGIQPWNYNAYYNRNFY